LNLVSIDPQTGQIKPAERSSEIAAMLVPMGLMMLMFMVVMVGAPPLLQSVMEEKMQRIAEVLLGSVGPFELMLGKLIGMVGVSLTIVTVYLLGAYFGARRTGYLELIPFHLAGWFIVYQTLAVVMFGSVFISIGAAVSDARDAQSMVTPAMLLLVSPMFVWLIVAREPTSTLATALSLFPPATPMLMVLRAAAAPNLPLWQPVLGIVLTLVTTLLFVFAAGRIFRVGLLIQGKGARLGDMVRWVISG
jgi:ABC-2 type transport system permease protein